MVCYSSFILPTSCGKAFLLAGHCEVLTWCLLRVCQLVSSELRGCPPSRLCTHHHSLCFQDHGSVARAQRSLQTFSFSLARSPFTYRFVTWVTHVPKARIPLGLSSLSPLVKKEERHYWPEASMS